MKLNRNRLYAIMLMACIAGYIWLYFSLTSTNTGNNLPEVCLIKHATNLPCPSCGSTRSVVLLTKGNFTDALSINPLGYLVAIIMLITPLWITIDIITKKNTFFGFYKTIEIYLKRPQYAIPLILLVLINWIWNITKGL